MRIAVLKELAAGETRVAATPETVKKFIGLGAEVAVESGAGEAASVADADYSDVGASVARRADVLKGANNKQEIQGPDPKGLSGFADGAWLAAGLNPFGERARVDEYAKLGLEALAMEFMPRITRAQSMDILSSQSNLAGYKVYWRLTTEPQWTHSRWAGNVETFTLEDVVIDNYFFGVAAVAKDGTESPVVFPGAAGSFGGY